MLNRVRRLGFFAPDGFISNPVNCLARLEFPPWLASFGIFLWLLAAQTGRPASETGQRLL
jgi:hypothetical protein